MNEFTVHTILGSPYARAVMLILEEKGAAWTLAPIEPGAHKEMPHLARHPFARVPVLEHNGFSLYETQAIVRYLDRILPEPSLTPTDPKDAARMDQIINVNDFYLFLGCATAIIFQRIVGPQLFGLPTDEAVISEAMPRARVVFTELSRLLGREPYFGGSTLSLADLMIAPQLDLFTGTPEWVELTSATPNLVAWLGRMNARPSMQATSLPRLSAMIASPAAV